MSIQYLTFIILVYVNAAIKAANNIAEKAANAAAVLRELDAAFWAAEEDAFKRAVALVVAARHALVKRGIRPPADPKREWILLSETDIQRPSIDWRWDDKLALAIELALAENGQRGLDEMSPRNIMQVLDIYLILLQEE